MHNYVMFTQVFNVVVMISSQAVRIRRLLRPFFLIQNSSLMKKLVSSGLHKA